MTSKNTVKEFIADYIASITNEGYIVESLSDSEAVLFKRFYRGVIGDCLRYSETSFEHRFVVTPESTYKDFIDSQRRLLLAEFKEVHASLDYLIYEWELEDNEDYLRYLEQQETYYEYQKGINADDDEEWRIA